MSSNEQIVGADGRACCLQFCPYISIVQICTSIQGKNVKNSKQFLNPGQKRW